MQPGAGVCERIVFGNNPDSFRLTTLATSKPFSSSFPLTKGRSIPLRSGIRNTFGSPVMESRMSIFEPVAAREPAAGLDLGAREDLVAEVCDILTHHRSSRTGDSVNFRAVVDADALERLEADHKQHPIDADELTARIERFFLTGAGRQAGCPPCPSRSGICS